MRQVNISFKDELLSNLNKLAEEKGVPIVEFCRQILTQIYPQNITALIHYEKGDEWSDSYSATELLVSSTIDNNWFGWFKVDPTTNLGKSLSMPGRLQFRIPVITDLKTEYLDTYGYVNGFHMDGNGSKVKFFGIGSSPLKLLREKLSS